MADRHPIGPKTVTVNGGRWTAKSNWRGLYLDRAELLHKSLWNALGMPGDDYHLRVPWLHPDDAHYADDPDSWAFYRVRPKRDRDRFVRVDGVWMVEEGDRWLL